jgi:predicted nucleotidyltransferase
VRYWDIFLNVNRAAIFSFSEPQSLDCGLIERDSARTGRSALLRSRLSFLQSYDCSSVFLFDVMVQSWRAKENTMTEQQDTIIVNQEEVSLIVERLVDVYHPLRIYLFGSYAWGTPTVDSDYDICVIVESSDEKKRHRTRIGYDALLDILRRCDIDLIVYTANEFDRAASHPSSFASPIKLKGVLLYDQIS